MLVLSRRQSEKVDFPSLGISVEVLRIAGNSVQIGIDAPPSVRILRHELLKLQDVVSNSGIASGPTKDAAHDLRDRMNAVMTGLQMVRYLIDSGKADEARNAIHQILALVQDRHTPVERRSTTDSSSPQLPGNHQRALIVEDDANERSLLAVYLRSQGFEVDTAADGVAAMERLTSHERPDFVLLDMRMPRMDGPATIAQIRKTPRCNGMKIYGVSGADPADCGVNIGPSGVDSWFSKPLDPAKIVAELSRNRHAPVASV